MKPDWIKMWLLVLAAFLLFGSIAFLVKPEPMLITPSAHGRSSDFSPNYHVRLSKAGSRVYGCLGIAFAAGIVWFVFYPTRK